MKLFMQSYRITFQFMVAVAMLTVFVSTPAMAGTDLGPLPAIEANKAKAELGQMLFFDPRLSGDAAISCATCHDPNEGFTKNIALGDAYPGSKHFRNAPTLINTAAKKKLGIPWHWDGRIGTSLNDMTRDQITDTYVLNMDMRIMQERLKQIPKYVEMFKTAFGKEPNNGRVRNSVPEFLKTITSSNVPFDKGKLSGDAKVGQKVFKTKGCINCHNGPALSDGMAHNTGVPENPEVFKDVQRHVTYLTYMYGLGVENRMNWRRDIGYMTVSHNAKDLGSFVTPTLRELKYTAPYMHNGMIASLDDVIEHYNKGGGPDRPGLKDPAMKPLNLSKNEKKALKAFLLSLSGDKTSIKASKPDKDYPYQVIADWYNTKN